MLDYERTFTFTSLNATISCDVRDIHCSRCHVGPGARCIIPVGQWQNFEAYRPCVERFLNAGRILRRILHSDALQAWSAREDKSVGVARFMLPSYEELMSYYSKFFKPGHYKASNLAKFSGNVLDLYA